MAGDGVELRDEVRLERAAHQGLRRGVGPCRAGCEPGRACSLATRARGLGNGDDQDPVLADINVTPLVDVMLVLLIIFMIAAPMLHQGVEVALPKAEARNLPLRTEDPLVVSIDRNEVLLERDHTIEAEDVEVILDSGVKSIILHRDDINISDYNIIFNTLAKDTSNSEKEAVEYIYRQLRNTEAPDEQTARDIIQSLFFSEKRYDLGEDDDEDLGTSVALYLREGTSEQRDHDIDLKKKNE